MRTVLSALGTVARGVRARALLSTGSVLLVTLAVASALLGPTFADSVSRSYVLTRLAEAPNFVGGQSWLFTPTDGQPETALAQALTAVRRTSKGPYRATVPQLESARFTALGGRAYLIAKDGACAHLELASGRCPEAPDEALMAEADREGAQLAPGQGVKLGDVVELAGAGPVRLVGFYQPLEADDDYWFVTDRLASVPQKELPSGQIQPARFGPVIVDASQFTAVTEAPWQVRVDLVLDIPSSYTPADLREALAARTAIEERGRYDVPGGILRPFSLNDLASMSADVNAQQRTAQASVAPAVLSLILVALALLMRLIAAAADLRVPELALAALRGMPGSRMWVLGLAEPLLLLVVGLPLGLGLGLLSSRLLARWWLVPGLPVPVSGVGLVAVLGVVLAAAAVSVVVVSGVLRRSLAGQLSGVIRPTRSSRAGLVAELLVVASAAAVLAGQLASKQGGSPDITDLLLPVLLAVAAGLLTTRAVAGAARWWTRERPQSRWLPGYVARRAIARRREGTLVVLPLAAAIAVGVFALGAYDAGATWRHSVAATVAPADEVWLSPESFAQTQDLTRQLDPDGEWLMASSVLNGPTGGMVLLDTPRLARVTGWPAEWSPGYDAEDIAGLLGPTGRQPTLTGTRVGLTVTRDLDAGGPVFVGMTLHVTGRTDQIRVTFGPIRSGTHTLSARIPECRSGCTWEELAVGGAATLPEQMAGSLRIGGLTVDGDSLDDAMTGASWAEADTKTALLAQSRPTGAELELLIDTRDDVATVRYLAGSTPVFRPVVLGESAGDNLRPVDGGMGYPLWADRVPVRPVLEARSVPFLGPEGTAVDSTVFTAGRRLYEQLFTPYVLARADMPREVRQALTREGLTLRTTRASEQRILDRSAYALALRLYVVVAVVVVLIALVGLLVTTAVQMPSRRRDAAALRVVGVSRRAVVTAVVWEVLVVLGAAGVAGILAGTVAQDIVLRTVTLGYAEAISTPRPVTAVDSVWLALVSGTTAAVLAVVAAGSAALTVRGARGATLRESAR